MFLTVPNSLLKFLYSDLFFSVRFFKNFQIKLCLFFDDFFIPLVIRGLPKPFAFNFTFFIGKYLTFMFDSCRTRNFSRNVLRAVIGFKKVSVSLQLASCNSCLNVFFDSALYILLKIEEVLFFALGFVDDTTKQIALLKITILKLY